MHDPDENNDDVSQGETIDLERSESESATRPARADGYDRRTVLQALIASGGAGAFGSDLFVNEAVGETSGTSTSGWEKKEPQLETPWTDEVGPDNAHPEYPRPQMVRADWQNLNGVWQFSGASKGESPPIGQELAERVLVPYPIESGLSGIKRHEVWMWYRRHFTVPNSWFEEGVENTPDAQRLLLHFEAIDWDATVYVNGQEVATHQGGYDHFVADITGALTEEGPQELVVGVFDPTGNNTKPIGTQPVGRQGVGTGYKGEQTLLMTPTSGIWQTVWLEPVPETRIDGLDMTPNLNDEVLHLTVNATNAAETTVEATAYDGNEKVGSVTGPPNEELDLSVPDSHLWSPDDPFLYDLEITLHRNRDGSKTNETGGKPVDSVTSYFGMRSLGKQEINGIARPTLNGEAVYQLGSLESGWWPDGIQTPPTDEAQIYNIEAQKELGFNMVRKHMKIESRRWFYHTDRLGLLVYQDMPNMPRGQNERNKKAHDQFETELRAMVSEHDNHPSAAVWIPFNEKWGIAGENLEYVRKVAGLISKWDPERFVDPMSGYDVGAVQDSGAGDIKDIHEYPGPLAPPPEPDRFSLCGEYSSPSLVLPEHKWGECPSPATPEEVVSGYVEKVDKLQLLMVQKDLSGSVYTATTDLENVCNGLITYDRKVLKPTRAENGLERVRKANETLIEQSRVLMENASIDYHVPDTYLPDESFEITAMFTNPESTESTISAVDDVTLTLSALPDGWTSTADTPTQFDTVADGESVTARWEVTTDSTADGDIELQLETAFGLGDEEYKFTDVQEMGAAKIAFWRFENGNTDSSSYEHTFSLKNGASYNDQVATEGDYSLRLDGADDYAQLAEFGRGFLHKEFTERTVSMWIKPDSTTGTQCLYNEGGSYAGFAMRINGGTLQARAANTGNMVTVSSSFDRTDWTHVAAVFDNGALRLYVNGTEVAADSDAGYDTVPRHVAGGEIGGATTTNLFDDGQENFFGGHVDATAIYNYALSADRISALTTT